jgi:hypothetical protein
LNAWSTGLLFSARVKKALELFGGILEAEFDLEPVTAKPH